MQKGRFNTVVDSAWGSSGKGAVSTRLADIHGVSNLSSCNYPNAGHSVVYEGRTFVFKVLPSGTALKVLKGKPVTAWVGPNSGFKFEQLIKELEETNTRPMKDVFIHERAVIVTDDHIEAESAGGSSSTLHVSSTMSGSGAAFTEKAMRRPNTALARSMPGESTVDSWAFYNMVQNELDRGNAFLHEVSQGFALSVNHGTHYPFCTFRDCTPQQAYADFGIVPHQVGDVYLNVRSLPIRVGSNFDENGVQVGYSGDTMPDSKELTWEQVAREAEMPNEEAQVLAERERTTVTKKIRRVFTPSWELLRFSAKFCGATKLVCNFPQYIHWSAHGVRGGKEALEKFHPKVRAYIDTMQEVTNLPVVLVGTGADHNDFVWLE